MWALDMRGVWGELLRADEEARVLEAPRGRLSACLPPVPAPITREAPPVPEPPASPVVTFDMCRNFLYGEIKARRDARRERISVSMF